MFPDRNRVITPLLCCFKTTGSIWKRMCKTINTVDYENGGYVGPAFFGGPENTLDDTVIVFMYTEVEGHSEAWEQVQNKLPVHAVMWTTEAPKHLNLDVLSAHCAACTDYDNIPIIDFTDIPLTVEE